MQNRELAVRGMTCANCSARVERVLQAVPGVVAASVSLATERASIQFDESRGDPAALAAAVTAAGYVALDLGGRADAQAEASARSAERDSLRRALGRAIALSVPVLLLAMGPMALPPLAQGLAASAPWSGFWDQVQMALAGAVIVGPGRRFFHSGLSALLHAAPDMNTLVMMGAGASWLYSALVVLAPQLLPQAAQHLYFESAAVVLTLILMGKYLEAIARGRAGQAIAGLAALQSPYAWRVRAGVETQVPIAELVPGDLIRVRPGERIAADGQVVDGESYVDESMMSGEPMPRARAAGDPVLGGTVNQLGVLTVTVQKVGDQTALAQIIRLVETAQGARLPIQRFADRVVAVFTLGVLALAALTFVAWLLLGPPPALTMALVSAVAVLVVACPCAMGLATPAAVMVGSGRAAQLGVLFRNGDSLERLTHVDTIVFDKTGTLTLGHPQLVGLDPAPGRGAEELLQIAAAVEAASEHPLAVALRAGAAARGLTLPAARHVMALPGLGVRADVGGREVVAGSRRLLAQQGVELPAVPAADPAHAQTARTGIHLAVAGQYWGALWVADPIRPGVRELVAGLRARGLRVALLSGDSREAAQALADEAGISDVEAEVLPAQKAQSVQRRQQLGQRVAFVGDGINDAPALAQADVGIALSSGTQIAMESADITLFQVRPAALLDALHLAARTLHTIRANLFWAFAYNVLLVPVATGVFYPRWGIALNPMFAALAMALSSVFVLSNSLRLRRTAGSAQ